FSATHELLRPTASAKQVPGRSEGSDSSHPRRLEGLLNTPALPVRVAKVEQALPIIYTTRSAGPSRLPPAARLLALGAALACLTVLTVAAWATPDPSGVGTHHSSLHMQPCHFLQTTGLPCPGCGMTTSFAWFARGTL